MKKTFKKICTLRDFVFDNYGDATNYPNGSEGILCNDGEVQFEDGNKFHVPYEFFQLVDDQPYVELIAKSEPLEVTKYDKPDEPFDA